MRPVTWFPTKLKIHVTFLFRNIKTYTFSNAKKLSKKKFLHKSNLLKHKTYLGTNQGVFKKKEAKGYLNMH